MEKLQFGLEIKEVGPEGTFEGWASTYGLDLGNDKVLPGAFKTSIRKTGGDVPVLFNHNRDYPIGKGTEALEDHKGLYVKAKLVLSCQKARETFDLLEAGVLKGLSIGFKLPPNGWVMDGKVRLLKAIDLVEYSVVAFPMQPDAQITRVKSVEDITTARDLEEALREAGFSKKEALCLMAKGGNQLLKERREAGSDNDVVPAEEAERFLYDLQKHVDTLSANQMLSSLSQLIT